MPTLTVRDGVRSVVRDVNAPATLDSICPSPPPAPYARGWRLEPDGASVALVSPRGERAETIAPGGAVTLGHVTLAVREAPPSLHGSTDRLPRESRERLGLRLPTGAIVALTSHAIVLGKGARSDVVLNDATVSERHCTIVPRRDGWEIRDAGSTNGTRVGGVRVEVAMLAPGVIVHLGRVAIECVRDAEPRAGSETRAALVGSHPAMEAVREAIERFAPNPYPVLIQGETGSGKEVVARLLHQRSPRARGPFVAINAGAIPPELVESELFGHERGAFTGAANRRRGVFEEASGGTLFLDELGELPLAQQARLLRVLETREIRRVGGEGTIPVDLRVVCATHRDLRAMSARGAFRTDLLYRLDLLRIAIPSLRHRREDIPALCDHLLARIAIETGATKRLDERALARLLAYDWPGNVRELYGVLCRAAALDASGLIVAESISFPPGAEPATEAPPARSSEMVPKAPPARPQIEHLRALFDHYGGNVSRVARATGLARSTVRDKLRRAR